MVVFITLHLFLTSETHNSDCQKNKLQRLQKPTPGQPDSIYRKNQAQFHIGHVPNYTYCMHTNWSLQKTPNYWWKEAMWQTQTALQLQRILWSNDSFTRCLSVLIFYNLAKEKMLFLINFQEKKHHTKNPKVKIPTGWKQSHLQREVPSTKKTMSAKSAR